MITVLTLNVIYTYYLDHTLFILVIRAAQVVRLLFPYPNHASHQVTAVLLVCSTIPVLLVHAMLLTSAASIGDMLFINFIGPEPKPLSKIFAVDLIILCLQATLLQCKSDTVPLSPLTVLPVPITDPLQPPESPPAPTS